MKILFFAAALILVVTAQSFAQNKSVYTSTRAAACRTIESHPEEAGYYEGECKGIGGYKIRFIEGDLRQTLDIITPAKKKFELNFWHYYYTFSYIGEKIEWRTKKGVPVELIARFNVADINIDNKTISYLMISKIGKKSSCVTDVVPPGEKQNEKARELADLAETKPCKPTGSNCCGGT